MSWKAHGSKELAFERLVDRIVEVVQRKYPHLTRTEAMQRFIDGMKAEGTIEHGDEPSS